MAQAQFPDPPKLDILEIGDGTNVKPINYSLDHPHPGFGKDPNIINEYGHTRYPKWVGDQIVNSAEEEAELTGEKVELPKPVSVGNGWS